MKIRNTKGKLALIRAMMIGTQLLLLGFVLHWLDLQYKEREQLLVKNINDAWSASQQQMVDSILLKEYIKPALDSSTSINYRYEINADSTKKGIQGNKITTLSVMTPANMPPGNRQIILRINDSTDLSGKNKKRSQSIMTPDLVLRGVKLFVNHHGDSTGERTLISENGFVHPDTTILKTVFDKRISGINPSMTLTWKTDSIISIKGNPKMISYNIIVGEKNLEAGIKGYRLAIFRDIWPQLVFAVFLIFLSAGAFIISFRNLKSQISLNNQRNDFIRNMSHELKTPVATVKVALEALKNFNRRNDPLVMDQYLDMATAETNRLEMMISRVMSVSSGNGEALEPNTELLDFKKLINEVFESFKPRLEAENATIILNLPGDEININVDRLHLQGVLINLIDNSLKYSNPPVEIEISLVRTHDQIKVSVSDRGEGIPSEYRNRIFGKFFRVPTGDKHDVKGYGLGLSYAKLVVEQHGGHIKYTERPGGGSIFEFTLPVIK
jgi:signal transduction histidine kinase